MKLYFAAFLKGQRLMNKDPAKSLYPIDDDGVKIQSLMTFLRSCSCCNDKKKKERCGSCVALGEWTNIPRDMVLMRHGNNSKWSTNLGKYRGEINGETVPSFYVDGGKRNHKKEPGVIFTIVVGTVIYVRPAVSKREDEHMQNLEFRAVEVIDVDTGIIVPPSPSSSSVVSFEFDDEINNTNNNNANTLVVVKQEAARNDDVPVVVEGPLTFDIESIFGTTTTNSSSKNKNNDDDDDDEEDDDDDDDGDLMSFTPRGLDPPCSPPRNNIWVFS